MKQQICTKQSLNFNEYISSYKCFTKKTIKTFCSFLVFITLFVPIEKLKAQTITWNCNTITATSPASISNLTIGSFSQGNNNGTTTLITSTSASNYTTPIAASGTSNFGAAARTGAINTAANGSAFFEVTLTPASGFTVSLTGFGIGSRSTATGPQAIGLRTSADNFGANIATQTVGNNSTWTYNTPTVASVTSAAGTALVIRIYGYAGTGSATAGTANWRVDDISLTVSVASSEVAPAAPTSGGNLSACVGGTIPNISASAPSGAVVDWYDAPTGGNLLASNSNSYNTNQTNAGVYIFYAQSRNNPGTLVSASRTSVSLTINNVVTPIVSAIVDDNNPTPGQTINFTATPTNGGSNPTYQWFKNNSPISGANSSTYITNNNYSNGDVFFVEMTSNAACISGNSTVSSNNVTISIDNSACSSNPPATTSIATNTTICSGGNTVLSLLGLGAQTGFSYQWQSSSTQNGTYTDVSGETNSTFNLNNATASNWYRCVVTCTNSSQSTISSNLQIIVNPLVNPSVTIVSSQTPSCSGALVTYTATPVNGGSNPTYKWYLNGNEVNGVTGNTFSSSTFVDGDLIYTTLTSNASCLANTTANSATALQNVNANVAASVSITSSANPACANSNVTFNATPTNGGSNPTYQWYNGITPISGANNSTYSSSSLTNNASISVIMTSNATCVTGSPATSNTIVQGITANVTPSLSIASNNNPVCISGNARFNISPNNGGATPTYSWYVNGVLVPDSTSTTFWLNNVVNGDSVYAIMTSSLTCVTNSTAKSNTITQTVLSAPVSPSVSINASPSTTITLGTNITFTANITNGGTTPTYQWRLNGNNTVTTANYSSINFQNGDVISLIINSNHNCVSTTTATSNNLTVTIVNGTPFTPGNLIVYRVGDSSTNLVNTGNPVYLSEFTPTGTLVQNIRLTKIASGQNSIFANGTSTSEGMLNLSADGRNIVVPGYYSNSTNSTVLSSSNAATINRVVGLVDRNINLDTTTRLSDWATSNTARSAIANGNNVWVSGGAGGVRVTTRGSSTSTQVSTSVANLRNLQIFNGQLYASSQSGSFRLAIVGNGLPTTSGQTIVNLNGLPTTSGSPYGFYFADLNSSIPGYDVLYYADDNTGTLVKYSLVGSTWTLNNSITATAIRGLVGITNGGVVTLFGTTGGSSTGASGTASSRVYTFTDNSGYNANLSGTISTLVDRSTASWIAYRGITFAPTGFAQQPTNQIGCAGSPTTFTCSMVAGTSSDIYTYQWQTSNNGTNWSNVTNAGVYSNATSPSLNISDVTGLDNLQFRCVVTYMGNYTLTSDAATLTVPVTVTPSLIISSNVDTVCSGSSTIFTATPTNGGSNPIFIWKKNGTTVSTGSSNTYTFVAGSLLSNDIVSCDMQANNPCQTINIANSNNITIIVNQSPTLTTINSQFNNNTTAYTSCKIGQNIGLYSNLSGGVWSTSNSNVVSLTVLNANSSAIQATSSGNGTANVIYTRTQPGTTCTSISSIVVTVAEQQIPNSIVGSSSVCVGSTNTYTTTSSGGVWSTQGRATINPLGVSTATSAGTTAIVYTTTNANGCSASTTLPITINALPAVPSITYAPGNTVNPQAPGGFCTNRTFNLLGIPSGGVWSKTGVINITVGGQVSTGAFVGSGSLTYTFINANGCSNSRTIAGNVVACASRGNNLDLITNSSIKLFPNPAKNFVNINLEKAVGIAKLNVINMLGKQVLVQNLSLGNNTINTSALPKGMYIFNISSDSGTESKKIIIE